MNILIDKDYILNFCANKFPTSKLVRIEEYHTLNSAPTPALVGFMGVTNVLYIGQLEITQSIYLDDPFLSSGRGLKYRVRMIVPTSLFNTNAAHEVVHYKGINHSQNIDTHYFQDRASSLFLQNIQVFKSVELQIQDDLGNTPTYNSCSQGISFIGYRIIIQSNN